MTRLATNSLLDEHIKHVSKSIADDLAKPVILYSITIGVLSVSMLLIGVVKTNEMYGHIMFSNVWLIPFTPIALSDNVDLEGPIGDNLLPGSGIETGPKL